MSDIRKSVFYVNGVRTEEEVQYTVRKLADGNCWMTENLALNWDGASRTFTSDDTNVTSDVVVDVPTQALDAVGGEATTAEADTWKEPSAGVNSDRWLSRSTNNAKESSYSPAIDQTEDNQPLGTYYNWYTAVLGTVTTSDGAKVSTEDICPKGWSLSPYDENTVGSWMYLIRNVYHIINTRGDQTTLPDGNTQASVTLHGFPISLPYSGIVTRSNGGTTHRGTQGFFWSAGSNSGIQAWDLNFYENMVRPESVTYKTNGFSVRCIAKQPANNS